MAKKKFVKKKQIKRKQFKRSGPTKRKHFKKVRYSGETRDRISSITFPKFYPDNLNYTMKSHMLSETPFDAIGIHQAAIVLSPTGTAYRFRLNAGGSVDGTTAHQPWVFDTSNVAISGLELSNFDMMKNRYILCRPMAAKVSIKVFLPDSTTYANTPLCVAAFPYIAESTSGPYSNSWDGTSVLQLNSENIGKMKYGKVKRIYGQGSKSYTTISFYVNFAKLLGRTHEQYLADPEMAYECEDGTSLPNPIANINLALVVSDFSAGTQRQFQMEAWITQYVRFEGTLIKYD